MNTLPELVLLTRRTLDRVEAAGLSYDGQIRRLTYLSLSEARFTPAVERLRRRYRRSLQQIWREFLMESQPIPCDSERTSS